MNHKADKSIERYNDRLVAKKFTKNYGVDYQDTFVPVVKMNIIEILLSCIVSFC